MKKRVVLIAVVAALAVSLGGVGLAYAAGGPPGDKLGNETQGALHDLMIASMASALDISTTELESRLDAGETPGEIALDLGFEEDQIFDLLDEARAEALAQAVEDGLITQEQADWMLEHPHRGEGRGEGMGPEISPNGDGVPYGDGTCDGDGPVGQGARRGGPR